MLLRSAVDVSVIQTMCAHCATPSARHRVAATSVGCKLGRWLDTVLMQRGAAVAALAAPAQDAATA